MYRIYADEVLIGSVGNGMDLINPVLKLEENTAGSFEFRFSSNHPFINYLTTNKSILTVHIGKSSKPYWKGFVTDQDVDFKKNKRIVCTGMLSALTQTIQKPASYSGVTPRSLLESYVSKHNEMVGDSRKRFTVGTVTVEDSNDSITCFTNYNSTWQEIKEDLIDDLGGIIRVRYSSSNSTNYLDLLASAPKESTQTVEFGINLLDLDIDFQANNLCTVVYPIGKTLDEDKRTSDAIEGLDEYLTIKSKNDGVDYLINEDAAARYGRIAKVVKFDDVTTASKLKKKGQQYLQSTQFENIVIEATAIDLAVLGAAERFELSDAVRCVSKPHGMDSLFRVTKIEKHLAEPSKDKITLGASISASASAQISGTTSSVSSISAGTNVSVGGAVISNGSGSAQSALNIGYVEGNHSGYKLTVSGDTVTVASSATSKSSSLYTIGYFDWSGDIEEATGEYAIPSKTHGYFTAIGFKMPDGKIYDIEAGRLNTNVVYVNKWRGGSSGAYTYNYNVTIFLVNGNTLNLRFVYKTDTKQLTISNKSYTSGGSGGSTVAVSNLATTGTKIATITVNGVDYDIKAPTSTSTLTSMEDIEF